MLTLFNGFERDFSRALARHHRMFHGADRAPGFRSAWPSVEVVETNDDIQLQADVPGFSADDLNITLHEGVLTIEGDTAGAKEGESKEGAPKVERKVLFSERRQLKFTRTFRLNQDVDHGAVSAAVKDGVLTVTLPKVEAAKPTQIAVVAK